MTKVTGAWLEAVGTQAVLTMLEQGGHQAYAVGGCVRNALLREPVADVDISTDARPERVIALAKAVGLKPVPTGIDHGTITVVHQGIGYEVTTFRADVETDGRRAVVQFSDSIAQDAVRRDFTMNALYADRHGQLVDPLGGLPDLQARCLRFIQNPTRRIREDYLRILRFFRFFAWYGDPAQGMDADALAAIADNLDGLEQLSAERIGVEVVKLLSARDPFMAVCVMEQTGVLARILPGALAKPLGPLLAYEAALAKGFDPLRRLAAIGFGDGAALRLSKAQQRRLTLLRDLIGKDQSLTEIAYRHDCDTATDVMILRAASYEAPVVMDDLPAIRHAAQQRFPVRARDLADRLSGKALGDALRALERDWIASGFTLDRAQLLASINQG
ncbi:MAG: CCA tRNA nucleotidyltransferase [Pelagimonas sp.]|jgi:poly(A) polymerase|nr:CCA tRNA nucleotidyltransferase [Pelagimonas sp.]